MATATCVVPEPASVTVGGLKVQATVAGEQEKVGIRLIYEAKCGCFRNL